MKISTVVLIAGGIIIGYMSLKLLAVAVVVFVVYLLAKRYEPFQSPPQFITKSEFSSIIQEDKDGFIDGLTDIDLYARKVVDKQQYKDIAMQLTYDFNRKEIKRIKDIVNSIPSKDLSHFGIDKNKWDNIQLKFAKSEYEDGYPHTRGDVIVLNSRSMSRTDDELRDTIIHEKVHIYQKMYPDDIKAYLDKAGFRIARMRGAYPLARANPDLDEYVYADKDGNIHISEYTSNMPSGIWDITGSSEMEHPLEMMAYQIAKQY